MSNQPDERARRTPSDYLFGAISVSVAIVAVARKAGRALRARNAVWRSERAAHRLQELERQQRREEELAARRANRRCQATPMTKEECRNYGVIKVEDEAGVHWVCRVHEHSDKRRHGWSPRPTHSRRCQAVPITKEECQNFASVMVIDDLEHWVCHVHQDAARRRGWSKRRPGWEAASPKRSKSARTA